MTKKDEPLSQFVNANPGYVCRITYEDVVIGNTIVIRPRVQKLHADTFEPVIKTDEKI